MGGQLTCAESSRARSRQPGQGLLSHALIAERLVGACIAHASWTTRSSVGAGVALARPSGHGVDCDGDIPFMAFRYLKAVSVAISLVVVALVIAVGKSRW